jgi:hypothetical protein
MFMFVIINVAFIESAVYKTSFYEYPVPEFKTILREE